MFGGRYGAGDMRDDEHAGVRVRKAAAQGIPPMLSGYPLDAYSGPPCLIAFASIHYRQGGRQILFIERTSASVAFKARQPG